MPHLILPATDAAVSSRSAVRAPEVCILTMPGGATRIQREAAGVSGREIQDGAAAPLASARTGKLVAAGTAKKLAEYARKVGGTSAMTAGSPPQQLAPHSSPSYSVIPR